MVNGLRSFLPRLIILFIGSLLYLHSYSFSEEIHFGTFNIRFFGVKEIQDLDKRDAALRRFFKKRLSSLDVISFQEIVDIPRFKAKVIQGDLRCHSYTHPNPKHLNVLLCHKKHLNFFKQKGAKEFAVREVALDRYRPAHSGVLYTKSGKPLAHVIGLHLKAREGASEIRRRQVEILSDYLEDLDLRIPVVVLGDFNTHHGDVQMIDRIFRNHSKLDLAHIPTKDEFTYRTPTVSLKLDHYWVSATVPILREPKVYRICNDQSANDEQIERYNEQISDHCPVKIAIDL